ncbi:hypothetical protein [Anaeromyxobacter paludicola]|uniref:Uncharacterized protein n=1 Tax=Anaeromyxobacter paludicola TaxID=2918171 RepID=A0ABN6N3I6_9BACT|nr:hypothetical protein [Anaeromyxobacter paludicola]BDG07626.1 hypothetical protein AMPC_07390 [Anaeromyxobacter paludicola]
MKLAARMLFLAGAIAIGFFLLRAAPRDLVLVYAIDEQPRPTGVAVDVLRDGETIRHAEFRFARGAPAQVRHPVKLTDGSYTLRFRLEAPGRPVATVERPLTVDESGPVVVNVAP